MRRGMSSTSYGLMRQKAVGGKSPNRFLHMITAFVVDC